jgi:uncharacterized membrane protein
MTSSLVLRSLGVGAATGLRSMAGPTLVNRTGWGRLLPILAIGELIVDKLPQTPSRTIPTALAIRAIGGALAGSSITNAAGKGRIWGALAGLAGAIGASYAGAAYRKAATRFVPPVVAALIEDGVAFGLATAVAKRS